MVKIWRQDYDCSGEGGIVQDEQGASFSGTHLNTRPGQLIPAEYSQLKMGLSTEPRGATLDFFKCGSMVMASRRLKAVLEKVGANVQYVPFEIVHDGKTLSGQTFYFCNILDFVNCLDYKRGVYTFWEKTGFRDHVDNIKKLAIDEKKAAGYPLFRIAKGADYIICVSDELAGRIENGGFKGIKFISPEDWTFA